MKRSELTSGASIRRLALCVSVFAALLLSGCRTSQYGASWKNLPRESAHGKLFAGGYEISASVPAMPDSLKDAFRRATRQLNFSLASPTGNEAERKLVVWGSAPDRAFVEYRYYNTVCVLVFKSTGSRYEFEWGGQGSMAATDFGELKRMVESGEFKDDQPYWW